MCVSVATMTAIAAVAQTANSYESARRARHTAEDAARAAELEKTRATQDANSQVAMRRRALALNSLDTGGGTTTPGGKTQLGGG